MGFFLVPWAVTKVKGNGIVADLGLRARGRTSGRAGWPASSPSSCCSRCCTGRSSRLLDKTVDDLEGPAQTLTDRANSPVDVVLLVLIVGVMAAVFEEIFYRGLLQRSLLKRGLRPVLAIGITSVLFGATHFQLLQLPGLMLAGAVFGTLAYRADRLGPAIAAHLTFNMVTVDRAAGRVTRVRPREDADDGGRHELGPGSDRPDGDLLVDDAARTTASSRTPTGTGCRSTTRATARGRPRIRSGERSATASSGAPSTGSSVVGVRAVRVPEPASRPRSSTAPCPSGGDMGAHVWGPAFLRDHLLTEGRLSGWTPDWYAGFPAYQFYMVVPSLLIVALDVGLFGGWLMIVPLAAGGGLVYAEHRASRDGGAGRRSPPPCSSSCSGSSCPTAPPSSSSRCSACSPCRCARYAFGRLAELPFPGPALLSVASVLFLFDRNFTIYGGNVASTLAGEFAFSISLSLALLYLGVVIKGLRTGQHRALAAVLLALTGLCHLIPAFFALAGTFVIVVMRRPPVRTWIWVACVLPVAGLISAFWVLPFWWQRDYVNDMGWEKLPYANGENGFRSLRGTLLTLDGETYWKYLIPRTRRRDAQRHALGPRARVRRRGALDRVPDPRRPLPPRAARCSWPSAFVAVGEGRLWNARLLPFYYLGLYLLAAIGVAEVGRTVAVLVAREPGSPERDRPGGGGRGRRAVGVRVRRRMPLRSLPGGELRADGSYSWFLLDNGVNKQSFVRSWAQWNYTGYEGKAAYAEYRDLVNTMERHRRRSTAAAGRSGSTRRRSTATAHRWRSMLLPHWTDGCIGSMEGLFFEASATTPFHFLTQVELSAAPSAAQRDLPYGTFDIDAGVRHLQLMGVRYYLASPRRRPPRRRVPHPDLTELATSGPWVIFEVANSELVEPLENEPAVLDGQSQRPARLDLLAARRERQVRRSRGHLVPRPGHPGRVPRRRRARGVAARRPVDDPDRRCARCPAPRSRPRGRHATGSPSTSTGSAHPCW